MATPVQVLRAAMRLHESFGHAGFVLTLMNAYTGARWSELIALEPHEYDEVNHAVPVRAPLRESGGKMTRAKRPKTPASKRWLYLPDFLDAVYTDLVADSEGGLVFTGSRDGVLRRGNFRTRFWRPAWDGSARSSLAWLRSPILPGFTFCEGRHTHRTWLAEEGVPEVARAARLGHKMPGMANVYEHVTPTMKTQVLTALEQRFLASVHALSTGERELLMEMLPRLNEYYPVEGARKAS